jgi:hypothetical protein
MNQIIGYVGAGLLLLGFILLSQGKIQGRSYTYLLMQFFGSAGVAFAALMKSDWSSMWLNAIWTAIATGTLIALWRKRRSENNKV